MKKFIAAVLVLALCFSLCACGGKTLSGTYVSETGTYTVVFEKDGTCTWYQEGMFFNGTYQETNAGWQLNITGNGLYGNTVFQVAEKGRDLIITGGIVYGEVFKKR